MTKTVARRKALICLMGVVFILAASFFLMYPPRGEDVQYDGKNGLNTELSEADCSAYSGLYRDKCLYILSKDMSSRGSQTDDVLKLCSSIKDVELNGYCTWDACVFALNVQRKLSLRGKAIGDSGSLVHGICDTLADEYQRSECYFLSAEGIAKIVSNDSVAQALKACQLSQQFEYDCIGHVAGQILVFRGRDLSLNFCRDVAEIYRNVSKTPVKRCYSHYFIELAKFLGVRNESVCGMKTDCYGVGLQGGDDLCLNAFAVSVNATCRASDLE